MMTASILNSRQLSWENDRSFAHC